MPEVSGEFQGGPMEFQRIIRSLMDAPGDPMVVPGALRALQGLSRGSRVFQRVLGAFQVD